MKSSKIALLILLAVISGGAIWLSFRADQPVRDMIVEAQGKHWHKTDNYRFYADVRILGDWPELMILGAVGLLIARLLRSREWTRILMAAMIASTLAGLVTNAVRITTGRVRPREAPKIQEGFYGPWHNGKLTIGDTRYNSFPSGHTATAFGFAGVIAFANPWLGVGALIVAGIIGWASISIGAHHPSDVVVSIVVSLVVAWFTWRWALVNGHAALHAVQRKIRRFKKSGRDNPPPQ